MSDELEDEVVKAISTLMSALKPLDRDARLHVLEFVLKRLGISLTTGPAAPSDKAGVLNEQSPRRPDPSAPPHAVDIRSFAAEKSPRTVNEKVAVIAYYIAHLAPALERRDYLKSDDIKTYFIQADFHLPTAPPAVTLANAKNAGYLNALDRGQFKLNAVGYNLVAHKLPAGNRKEKKQKSAKKSAKNNARPTAKK